MISVSVVIPFYSKLTGLLQNAVLSALTQTEHELEVIIVDDCSPVSAMDELANIGDERVRIIRHEKNSNGGIARNTGIDAAEGEFVAFLDYDDVWYSDKLENQIKLIRKAELHISNPVVYSRCKIIDGARVMIRPVRAIEDNERVGDYLFCARQIIQTSGILLKTSLAKAVRFDDLKRHQDYQFCLALENYGCKFFMLDTPSYEFIQIAKLNDFNFSIFWLKKYSELLTPKAIKGFNSLVVMRTMIAARKYIDSFNLAVKQELIVDFLKAIVFKAIKKIYMKVNGIF